VFTLTAEIISVGTELLLGEILDSNSAYLAGELKKYGFTLHHKSTVGDNLERLQQTLNLALSRSSLIILGGGLGPTDDDLTREGIAAVLNQTPQVDAELLSHLEGMYAARNRVMPQSNRKQAWLIPSAETLANPVGTAPGWMVKMGTGETAKVIVAMPGPPSEMKRMWLEQVLPRLELPQQAFFHTTLHTSGIGESNVAEMLGSQLTQAANPSVATYARRTGVDVRVAASASTLEGATALAQPVLAQVEHLLERFIFGRDDETLASTVLKLLEGRSETVAVSETASGGLIADSLSNAPSSAFLGGVVAKTPRIQAHFGATPVTEVHSLVSEQTALELAKHIREELGATWGLSSVGISDSSDATETIKMGLVYLAVVGPNYQKVHTLDWIGERRQIKERASQAALMGLFRVLRDHLEGSG
jgi:nicotinamide-nucleotide amidase